MLAHHGVAAAKPTHTPHTPPPPAASLLGSPRCRARAAARARRSAAASAPAVSAPPPPLLLNDQRVSEVMTSPALTVKPEATVFQVLELLVKHKISGVPVVDHRGQVLGIISGYDLLVLDSTPGHLEQDGGLFPPVGSCDQFGGSLSKMWNAFSDRQAARSKTSGSTAAEMCHEAVLIRDDALLEAAADAIVRQRVHRLAVVDSEGRCVGLLSRGDILAATLKRMRELEAQAAAAQ